MVNEGKVSSRIPWILQKESLSRTYPGLTPNEIKKTDARDLLEYLAIIRGRNTRDE